MLGCLDRRMLVGSGLAAVLAFASERTTGVRPRSSLEEPGIQLWTVDEELRRDLVGTLRRVAEIGFRTVETAGLAGYDVQRYSSALAAAGLRCISAHASMTDLVVDPDRWIGEARDLGASWIVCSSPRSNRPLPAGTPWIEGMTLAMDIDGWRRNAALLNDLSHRATSAGLRLGYHNHPAEFAGEPGEKGWDILTAQTDPNRVFFELDIAWAAAAGQDPSSLLKRHRGRITQLHLKDVPQLPPRGKMATSFVTVPPGHGAIDWSRIAAAIGPEITTAFIEVESPHVMPVFTALESGRRYLRGIANCRNTHQ